MPIIKPDRRIIQATDTYSFPLNVLSGMLTLDDEDAIEEMKRYKPRTKYKAEQLVQLQRIPRRLAHKPFLPRIWKIRFVISAWSYDLLQLCGRYGGTMAFHVALQLLEKAAAHHHAYDPQEPLIFAHGYPHGEYPDSAAWLPEACIKPLIFGEQNQSWERIVHDAGARYLGYDADQIGTNFTFDLAPDEYNKGSNIGRPFASEEALVNTLHFFGLAEMLEVPLIPREADRVPELDPEHEAYGELCEEEIYAEVDVAED